MIAVILVVIIGLGSAALAICYPSFITIWERELFGIDAVSQNWGNSELSIPAASGYRSLEEALDAYQVDAAIPTQILADFSIKDVAVSEKPNWTSFTAIYENTDGERLTLRVMCYPTEQDVPSFKLEKDANDSGETYTHNGIDFLISNNLGRIESLWNYGKCAHQLSGNITEEQIKLMINTIDKG